MGQPDDPIARIASALERLAPKSNAKVDWASSPAYIWEGDGARELPAIDAPDLDDLRGIDRQKSALCANIQQLARGHAAHDMLLWGARGMGKSALLRSAVRDAQGKNGGAPGLIQIAADALDSLPLLFAELHGQCRQYVIFIDDLGFAEDDSFGPRRLRSWLEGGVEARPQNARLAVTANRRTILARYADEQESGKGAEPLNIRDVVDDRLALADRFGLTLGFHPCDQETYLQIIAGYAAKSDLDFDPQDALAWAAARGQRSGRSAWQFVVELAGKAGKPL